MTLVREALGLDYLAERSRFWPGGLPDQPSS